MNKRTLLIATTNDGKRKEIEAALASLQFNIIGLSDLSETIDEPEEYGVTIEENALIKAKYYGDATGHLTVADDGGIFVDALNGWPGVQSARVADTDAGRVATMLERMEGESNRAATFETVLGLYDPINKSTFLAHGAVEGTVLKQPVQDPISPWGYCPIFHVTEVNKAFGDMTVQEKNEHSHRAKALHTLKYHLKKTYSPRSIIVPFSLVIRDNKVLMILRNDPGREAYHRKWEFPGGTLEFGEDLIENVVRETKEETGYDIEALHLLQDIAVESQTFPTFAYQVVLIPYICKVVGGELSLADEEALDAGWFTFEEVLQQELVGENKRIFEAILPELRQYLEDNPL